MGEPTMGGPPEAGGKVAGLFNRTKQMTQSLSNEHFCLKLPILMGSKPSSDLL